MTKQIVLILLVLGGLVQFSFGQKTAAPAKPKLVGEMVKAAGQIFPFENFNGRENLIFNNFDSFINEKELNILLSKFVKKRLES